MGGFCSTKYAAWVLILQGHGYMFGFGMFVKVKTVEFNEIWLQCEVIAIHGTVWSTCGNISVVTKFLEDRI